jgi:hypothetical protein
LILPVDQELGKFAALLHVAGQAIHVPAEDGVDLAALDAADHLAIEPGALPGTLAELLSS